MKHLLWACLLHSTLTAVLFADDSSDSSKEGSGGNDAGFDHRVSHESRSKNGHHETKDTVEISSKGGAKGNADKVAGDTEKATGNPQLGELARRGTERANSNADKGKDTKIEIEHRSQRDDGYVHIGSKASDTEPSSHKDASSHKKEGYSIKITEYERALERERRQKNTSQKSSKKERKWNNWFDEGSSYPRNKKSGTPSLSQEECE